MKAETKLLRLVHPENGGPRKRNILEGMARHYGEDAYLVDYLIAKGTLVPFGGPRNRTYGQPKKRKAR